MLSAFWLLTFKTTEEGKTSLTQCRSLQLWPKSHQERRNEASIQPNRQLSESCQTPYTSEPLYPLDLALFEAWSSKCERLSRPNLNAGESRGYDCLYLIWLLIESIWNHVARFANFVVLRVFYLLVQATWFEDLSENYDYSA